MVNLAKRMRNFQPKLLAIQYGKGAATLPPPPSPQLTRLVMRYPRTKWSLSNQAPRTFAKDALPRLKFHNPSLPIRVEDAEPAQLELTFEANDKGSLQALQKPPHEGEDFVEQWTEIESKPQPAASESDPSSTSPPSPIFSRNAKLSLDRTHAREIWRWFQRTTNAQNVPVAPQDEELRQKLATFFQQSEEDRKLVKIGVDAVKKQQADLKRAREAAERLTAES
ncbi:hypothetical protein EDD37DRAFT_425165 [Exophiala viscosa]|uniref:uncharacterized protein n=1 Tax=Exophiala viscosa TaxID=2486360 RepID=UPI002193815B|nr:hypothetical protein EDD37DRAFT_425165 [Exophiala viscosa]